MAVGLLAGPLGGFAREEDHASAGRHLRVAAGAGRHGGEHGAVPVAAAGGRPFPVDGEIPPAPHLLHLRLHLSHREPHCASDGIGEALQLAETNVCPDFSDSNNHPLITGPLMPGIGIYIPSGSRKTLKAGVTPGDEQTEASREVKGLAQVYYFYFYLVHFY